MDDLEIDKCVSLILGAAGITAHVESPGQRSVAESLRKYLEDLAESPLNADGDKQRIEIQGRHLSLRNILWEVLVVCASLLSSSGGTHTPPKIVTETAVVMAIANVSRKIKRLDAFQLELFRAVAVISQRKANAHKMLEFPGATMPEVQAFLIQNGVQSPADIESRLSELVPEVLSKSYADQSYEFYSILQ